MFNPLLTPIADLQHFSYFTLSNARRFYLSIGDLVNEGLKLFGTMHNDMNICNCSKRVVCLIIAQTIRNVRNSSVTKTLQNKKAQVRDRILKTRDDVQLT